MSAVNRSLRTVTRRLAVPRRSTPVTAGFARGFNAATRTPGAAAASFSTSARKMAGVAPPMDGNPVYDPEIKDIADYVHNKPIDSELAVSLDPLPTLDFSCN